MIVYDLNIFCARFLPAKADTPLIVDTNAVLARTVAFECFKPISGCDLSNHFQGQCPFACFFLLILEEGLVKAPPFLKVHWILYEKRVNQHAS
jgi:hypothetical protein